MNPRAAMMTPGAAPIPGAPQNEQLAIAQALMGMNTGMVAPTHTMGAQMTYQMAMTAPYAPTVTIRPLAQITGFEGVPLLGKPTTPTTVLMSMLGLPIMRSRAEAQGIIPFGMGHDQNIFNLLVQLERASARMESMLSAISMDAYGYMEVMRGLANLTGVPFGLEQQLAAREMISKLQGFMPLIAMMSPEFIDQMSGRRGSITAMTFRLANAGRIRIDPVTGTLGLTPETINTYIGAIFDEMLRDPSLKRTKGLSAVQLGATFELLQSYGLLPVEPLAQARGGALTQMRITPKEKINLLLENMTPIGQAEFLASLKELKNIPIPKNLAELNFDELTKFIRDAKDALMSLNDDVVKELLNLPEVKNRLTRLDAMNIVRKFESYGNAINAVKELFAEYGITNVTPEIAFRSLDLLTQGQLYKMTPQQLADVVRDIANISRMTQVSLDQIVIMQQHAAALAKQLGMPTQHTAQAVLDTVSYMSYIRGAGLLGFPTPYTPSEQQLTQLRLNVQQGFVASPFANMIAALMRMDREGKITTDPNNPLRVLLNNLQRGIVPSFEQMNTAQLTRLVQEGLTEPQLLETFFRYAGDVRGNTPMVQQLMRLAPRLQREEFLSNLANQVIMTHPAFAQMIRPDLNVQQRYQLARRISEILIDMPRQDYVDATRRVNYVTQKLMEDKAVQQFLLNNQVDQSTLYRLLTQGQFDTVLRQFGIENMYEAGLLFHSDAIAHQELVRMQSELMRPIQESMQHLGATGSIIRNIVTTLQNLKPGQEANISNLLLQAIGGVPKEEISRLLVPQLNAYVRQYQDIEKELAQLESDPELRNNPEARARKMEIIIQKRDALLRTLGEIASISSKFGINKPRQQLLSTEDEQLNMLIGKHAITQRLLVEKGLATLEGSPTAVPALEGLEKYLDVNMIKNRQMQNITISVGNITQEIIDTKFKKFDTTSEDFKVISNFILNRIGGKALTEETFDALKLSENELAPIAARLIQERIGEFAGVTPENISQLENELKTKIKSDSAVRNVVADAIRNISAIYSNAKNRELTKEEKETVLGNILAIISSTDVRKNLVEKMQTGQITVQDYQNLTGMALYREEGGNVQLTDLGRRLLQRERERYFGIETINYQETENLINKFDIFRSQPVPKPVIEQLALVRQLYRSIGFDIDKYIEENINNKKITNTQQLIELVQKLDEQIRTITPQQPVSQEMRGKIAEQLKTLGTSINPQEIVSAYSAAIRATAQLETTIQENAKFGYQPSLETAAALKSVKDNLAEINRELKTYGGDFNKFLEAAPPQIRQRVLSLLAQTTDILSASNIANMNIIQPIYRVTEKDIINKLTEKGITIDQTKTKLDENQINMINEYQASITMLANMKEKDAQLLKEAIIEKAIIGNVPQNERTQLQESIALLVKQGITPQTAEQAIQKIDDYLNKNKDLPQEIKQNIETFRQKLLNISQTKSEEEIKKITTEQDFRKAYSEIIKFISSNRQLHTLESPVREKLVSLLSDLTGKQSLFDIAPGLLLSLSEGKEIPEGMISVLSNLSVQDYRNIQADKSYEMNKRNVENVITEMVRKMGFTDINKLNEQQRNQFIRNVYTLTKELDKIVTPQQLASLSAVVPFAGVAPQTTQLNKLLERTEAKQIFEMLNIKNVDEQVKFLENIIKQKQELVQRPETTDPFKLAVAIFGRNQIGPQELFEKSGNKNLYATPVAMLIGDQLLSTRKNVVQQFDEFLKSSLNKINVSEDIKSRITKEYEQIKSRTDIDEVEKIRRINALMTSLQKEAVNQIFSKTETSFFRKAATYMSDTTLAELDRLQKQLSSTLVTPEQFEKVIQQIERAMLPTPPPAQPEQREEASRQGPGMPQSMAIHGELTIKGLDPQKPVRATVSAVGTVPGHNVAIS